MFPPRLAPHLPAEPPLPRKATLVSGSVSECPGVSRVGKPEEAEQGSRAAARRDRGAAEMLLQALVRDLGPGGLSSEDLCHEQKFCPGRCDPSSVQQIFPQLPLLCSSHHARCRTSNELGSFS